MKRSIENGSRCAIILALALAAALAAVPAASAAPDGARLVAVPGSDVVLRVWEQADGPRYAISLDGKRFSAPRATSYVLRLRHGDFDPLDAAAAPAVEPRLAAGDDTNLYIVQFLTQPLEPFRAAIRDLGGTVEAFLAQHAHVVRMDPRAREAVAALPFVRWVGPFHPAYRTEERVLARAGEPASIGTHRYNVLLFDSALATKEAVAERIEGLGGVVDRVHAGKFLLEATLDGGQLLAVLRWDDVAFADRWSPLEPDMEKAREIGGANFLEQTPEGWTGEGVRGEVIDVGFNLGHVDFAAQPLILHTSVGTDSHGAATSGIIFGDGTGNPMGRGMLPDAQGIVADTDSVFEGQPRYDHTGELVQSPYFAVFQSSSVGSERTFFYTTISADTDAMLFDFDIVHCQSQSNAGNQDSRPQAWAKNIISGGGVRHHDTLSKDDDNWGGGASTGPASDGRVKPDLTHFYDSIFTVTTGSSTAYTSSFGGTSGATPIIGGHVGLLFDMWADGAFGNIVDPDGTVFDNRCHMTTAKALLVNTASQYDWTQGGANADLTRFRQGWGMPDLRALHDLRFRLLIVDETDVLGNLESRAYVVAVNPGEPALRATLVYADPPGAPFSSQHRINDLSLKVTSPSGIAYWGNHGLLDGLWSVPGGAPNEIDTVENVFVADPEPGDWIVEVYASELVEDGHVETGELDADYALVVSGVEEQLPPLLVRLLDPVPALVPPGTPVELRVQILPGEEQIVPGTELLHWRFDASDPYTESPLVDRGNGEYLAVVPGAGCGDAPEFWMSAEGDGGTVVTSPANAPDRTYGFAVGEIVVTFSDDFETDTGWSVVNENLTDGAWERGVPAGGGDRGDPASDFDGSGSCYLTDNEDGNSDVDGGPTRLVSPPLDATILPDPRVGYARWFTNDDNDADRLDVEISDDDGATWTLLESVPNSGGWSAREYRIAEFVDPTDRVRLRFSATDNPNDSVTEAAVDAVRISAVVCAGDCPEDLDGSGAVDFGDVLAVLAAWGDAGGPEDLDGSGIVDFGDILAILAAWGPC